MARVKKNKKSKEVASEQIPVLQKGSSFNIEGYGDFQYNDDLNKFLTDKNLQNPNQGDAFNYVHNLFKTGGLDAVNAMGQAQLNTEDPSLTNKNASRRKYLLGRSKDHDRQVAAQQYTKWLQEYAQSKQNPTPTQDTPKPQNKTIHNYDLVSDVVNSVGGSEQIPYFENLDFKNRAGFVKDSLHKYGKSVRDSGAWNDETHRGQKDIYENIYNNLDRYSQDIDDLLSGDSLDQEKLANFVRLYKINPHSLLRMQENPTGPPASNNPTLVTNSIENNPAVVNNYGLDEEEGAGFSFTAPTGFETMTPEQKKEALSNPYNFRINDYTGYYSANPWDSEKIQRLQGRYLQGRRLSDDEENAEYDAWNQENLKKLIANGGIANATRLKTSTRYPELTEFSAKDSKIYDMKSQYPNFKGDFVSYIDSKGDRYGYALKEKGQSSFSRVSRVFRNMDPVTKTSSPWVAEVIKSDGTSSIVPLGSIKEEAADLKNIPIYGYKKGGTVNFDNVKKLQLGGRITDYNANDLDLKNYEKDKERQKVRSASAKEIYDGDFKLKPSDYAKIGALAADLGSLTATLIPGLGNTTAAAAGAAGTLANATANFMDKDNSGRSVGSILKEAGIGLALDAATLVPGVGTMGKGYKIIRGLRAAAPLLMTAFNAWGAQEQFRQAYDILKRQEKSGWSDITLDEMRALTNAVTAVVSTGKNLKSYSGKKHATTETDVQLNDKNNITFENKQQGQDFIDAVQARKKAQAVMQKTSNKTPDQIAEDVKSFDNANKRVQELASQGKVTNKGVDVDNYDLDNIAEKVKPKTELVSPVYTKSPSLRGDGFWGKVGSLSPLGVRKPLVDVPTVRGIGSKEILPDSAFNRYLLRGQNDGYLERLWRNRKANQAPAAPGQAATPQNASAATPAASTTVATPATNTATATPTPAASASGNTTAQTTTPASSASTSSQPQPAAQPAPAQPQTASATNGTPSAVSQQANTLNTLSTHAIKRLENSVKQQEKLIKSLQKNKNTKEGAKKLKSAEKALKGLQEKLKNAVPKAQLGLDLSKFKTPATNSFKPYLTNPDNMKPLGFNTTLELPKKSQLGVTDYSEKFNKPMEFSNILANTNNKTTFQVQTPETSGRTLLGDVSSGVKKVVTPRNLKFANTLITNAKLMDQIKKLPRPQNMVAPETTKLKGVGQAQYQDQLNYLTAQENSNLPMYSDAKLNSANRLALLTNTSQARSHMGNQMANQNLQIDSTNAQLYSQDAQMRAQTAAQNSQQQRQHEMMLNQFKQGQIQSNGKSFENLMSELDIERKQKTSQIDAAIQQQEWQKSLREQLKPFEGKTDAASLEQARAIRENAQLAFLKKQRGQASYFKEGGTIKKSKLLQPKTLKLVGEVVYLLNQNRIK